MWPPFWRFIDDFNFFEPKEKKSGLYFRPGAQLATDGQCEVIEGPNHLIFIP